MKDVRKNRKSRSSRRKIIGGKAVARVLNYAQQRELNEATDRRKQPAIAPTRKLVCSTGTGAPKKKQPSIPSRISAYAHNEGFMAAQPVTFNQRWRPLGPFCIPHGQTYGSGPGCRPSISGRISALAIDPKDPGHILIGSGGGGGIWETQTTGKLWTPRCDDQASLSIGAIAFDPSDPLTVYAGTGEGDSTLVDDKNSLGVGLLASYDGGANWTGICREPFEDVGFYDLAVDPLHAKNLLAATTVGLFESSDAGVNWTRRRSQRTWSVSIHPVLIGKADSTREVFAGSADGVFRSTNGGRSWSRVDLPGGRRNFERIEVCHAPSDGNVVYIFAASPNLLQPDSDPMPYLWRRNFFGGPFERVDKLPRDLVTEQSWYDWFAAVAPNNPDVLYIGAINAHKGTRSPSGLWHWENISAQKYTRSIHPDMHVIAFSPDDPNIVYIGCDGGVFRSPNGGKDWESLNKGLCLTEVEYLAQHPEFESWLIAGTQDNGTLQYQGNEVWHHISDGDGGDCAVSSLYPYTCYITFYGMGIARSKKGGGWNTWPKPPRDLIGPHVPVEDDYPDGALFYSPLDVCGRTVAQAGKKVCISTNGGDQWFKVTLDLRANELSSALSIPRRDQVFVGTTRGRLFRLDAVGKSWHQAQLTRPVIGNVSDILIDPKDPNRIFVTFTSSKTDAHVFRSNDSGASWTEISSGLPNIAVNAIEIDPDHPDTLFIGADVGLYRSDDGGESWNLFNAGLPNVLVKDLAFHKPSRLLRAGTQARGVWEIPVDSATVPSVDIYLRDNAADSGRLSPSPFGVNDPFIFCAQTAWWQCVDIKVDSCSLRTTSLDDVDFEIFGDDQSMIGISDDDLGIQFACGLLPENALRNQKVRVYVRVNNRGVDAATNVSVNVFYAPSTSITFPNLPPDFWLKFHDDNICDFFSWQRIATPKVIPSVAAGASKIIGFEWDVPADAPNTLSLLAMVNADNDPLPSGELDISSLITGNKKCGLRSVTIVNPSPANGPVLRAVQLDLRGTKEDALFSVVATQTTPHILRAVMLSKRLSKLAQSRKLKRARLSSVDHVELAKLFESNKSLKRELDSESVYAAPTGALLEQVKLSNDQNEPMIFFMNPKATSGVASIMQVTEAGKVVGGHTFQVID